MRKILLVIVVLCVSLSLSGCGSLKKEPEAAEKGSLNRSYKLVDDSGRESGTLILTPMGGAELRDQDGKIIGTFAPGTAAPEPVAEKTAEVPAAEKVEAETSEAEKTETPVEEPVADEDKKTE